MAGLRKVDDRQTSMPQRNAFSGVQPNSPIVRAAVRYRVGHLTQDGRGSSRQSAPFKKTGDTTHELGFVFPTKGTPERGANAKANVPQPALAHYRIDFSFGKTLLQPGAEPIESVGAHHIKWL